MFSTMPNLRTPPTHREIFEKMEGIAETHINPYILYIDGSNLGKSVARGSSVRTAGRPRLTARTAEAATAGSDRGT